MFKSRFQPEPGCTRCKDLRWVYTSGFQHVPCPTCGCSCPPHKAGEPLSICEGDRKHTNLKRDAYFKNHGVPELAEHQLTARERETIAEWRVRFPGVTMVTFLSWIEGQRYTPEAAEKDKLFQLDLAMELERWRASREARP